MYTVEWSQRQHVRRCAVVLPDCGLPWDYFLLFIDNECQYTARILEKEGLLDNQNGIVKPNAILRFNLKPTFDDISYFVARAMAMLQEETEEYRQKYNVAPEERLREIYEWRRDLFEVDLNEIMQIIVDQADYWIRRINPSKISEGDAVEIKKIHSQMDLIHHQLFGSWREKAIKEYHQTKGMYVTELLEHARKVTTFNPTALQMTLEVLGAYYELVGEFDAALERTKELLEYYERFEPNASDLWYAHSLLSDRYLLCFKTFPDAIERSFHHLELAQRYLDKTDLLSEVKPT